MKYIYNKETLEYITSLYDEVIDEDIKSVYGDVYISTVRYYYPKLEEGILVEIQGEELEVEKYKRYESGNYQLSYNEVIRDNKIIEIELKEYEYIEEGVLKYDYEAKRESLLQLSKRKEEEEKEKAFEFKGYMQPNRHLEDIASLHEVSSMMFFNKMKSFKDWKMKDKEGNTVWVELTYQEVLQLGMLMGQQTTKAMRKWESIREHLKSLSNEEIRVITNLKEYVESLGVTDGQ